MKKWLKYGLMLCMAIIVLTIPSIVTYAAEEVPVLTASDSGDNVWIYIHCVEGYEKYEIQRAESKDGNYSVVYSWMYEPETECYYEDYDVSRGKTYYYKVVASNNQKSVESKIVNLMLILDEVEISSEYDVKTGLPKINWEETEGADSYEVYRATAKKGQYKKVDTTTALNYIDKNAVSGKTYYYKVKAICSANTKANSKFSNIVSSKKVKADAKLATAIDKVIKNGEYKNVLTLANTLKFGTKMKLKNLDAFPGNPRIYGVKMTANEMFNIPELKNAGATLAFAESGRGDPFFNGEMVWVKKNGIKYARFEVLTYAVNIVKVSSDSTSAEILSEINSIAKKYYPTSKWKVSVKKYSDATASSNMKGLEDIYNEYLEKSGYGSYESNKYTLTIQNKSKKTQKVTIFVTVVPTLTRLTDTTTTLKNVGSHDIKVTWNKVSKADKYQVWRKVGENGTYKLVKTTTSLSFKDTTTKKNKVYYYKVKAIETSNTTQNSAFSIEKKIKCK